MDTTQNSLALKKSSLQEFVSERVSKALPNRWWNGVTKAVDKLFRRRQETPFWAGVVIIQIITLLTSLGISAILGEQTTFGASFFRTHILWMLWVIFFVIAWQHQIQTSMNNLNNIIVPHVASENDITILQATIVRYSNSWLQFLFGTSVSIVTTIIALGTLQEANYLNQPVGLGVFYFIEYGTMALYYYFLIVYMGIFSCLGKLSFAIFDTDPSNSVPILRLERIARDFVVTVASIFALNLLLIFLAFGASVFNATVIMLVMCVYILPIILLFITTQVSLANIIQHSKLSKLARIQELIQHTESTKPSPDKEQLEIIEKLLDYHDRVRNTPDSKFSLTAITNFIGSLLLPIFATILGNLNVLLSLLGFPSIP